MNYIMPLLERFKELNTTDQILLVTSFILLLTAIFTFVAALGARRSAKETRKTSLAQIITKLTDDYNSPEMYDAMLRLSEFKNQYPSDFRYKFAGEIRTDSYPPSISQLDADRRRVSHHFHKIWLLLDIKLLPEKYVVKLVARSQADFYLEIIEPLDEEKAEAIGKKYDSRCLDTFRRLYDKLK